jgi:hypothetical protein
VVEDGDRDLANVSPWGVLVMFIVLGSVIAGLAGLIITRVFPAIGWAAFYMPIIIPLELIVLGLSTYLVLVGLCLAKGRGGLLRTRQGILIYLGLFRFKISDIDRVEIKHLGPYAIKSAVLYLKNGGKRHLSLALADRGVEELRRSTP